MSVTVSDGTAAIVVVTTGVSGAVDTDTVVFFVVTGRSVVGEIDTGVMVVVGAIGIEVVAGTSGTCVEGVLSSVGVVCTVSSVVTTETRCVVVSGLVCDVVLWVVKGATGVTDCVVLVEVGAGTDTVPTRDIGMVG